MITANLIRAKRTEAGLSQRELGLSVGFEGIAAPQIISNIERTKCLPPWERVPRFAKALKTDAKEIYQAMLADEISRLEYKYKGII
jgi:transcriptional regulator with XRE-family HTH domain